MKNINFKVLILILFILGGFSTSLQGQNKPKSVPKELMEHRFLTFNTVIRVNQIEVTRNKNVGEDERLMHTPERVAAFREAISSEFPNAAITWSFSWLALHDTTENYRKIRELVVKYYQQYGDDVTFIPGAYFANAYNTREQVNKDLHEGLAKVSEIVGDGVRPKSVVAGFLAAENQQFLAEKEGIHVCQGNIWSQFSIDNQDGDGADWPDVKFITQGDFGLLWREHYKENSFDYRFEQKGSGIGGWSLLGEINQKQTRPQDKPKPIDKLSTESILLIKKYDPYLFSNP